MDPADRAGDGFTRDPSRLSRRSSGMDALPARPACTRCAPAWLALVLVPFLAGASARTTNFAVEAPTTEAAQAVARHAETCRRAIARAWLGRELPPWAAPCPIQVKLTAGEAGG